MADIGRMEKLKITIPLKKAHGYWVEVNGDLTDETMIAINTWVVENNLGKRLAYNLWKLKNKSARDWFILKWS